LSDCALRDWRGGRSNLLPPCAIHDPPLGYRIQGSAIFVVRRFNESHHAMLQRSPNIRGIPFGENMAIQIFSFSFRDLPLIDAVILAGIPSQEIR
jgi:hypothetical protein